MIVNSLLEIIFYPFNTKSKKKTTQNTTIQSIALLSWRVLWTVIYDVKIRNIKQDIS